MTADLTNSAASGASLGMNRPPGLAEAIRSTGRGQRGEQSRIDDGRRAGQRDRGVRKRGGAVPQPGRQDLIQLGERADRGSFAERRGGESDDSITL